MLRRIPPIFLAVVVFAGLSGQPARSEVTQAEAKAFISGLANKAIDALTSENTDRKERIQRFRKLLNQHFDVNTIGGFVLGRYWRSVTAEERKEYLGLFERLIIATYVDRFSTYSGETLDVTDAVAVGRKDIVVKSHLSRPTGTETVSIDWRVRGDTAKELRIIDVIVEGISMGQTQRSEFGSVISKNGGKVAGLIAELRQMDLPE